MTAGDGPKAGGAPPASDACPCGSGAAEAACCGPLLDGAAAPTALALMRSRYTAFVRMNVPYLVNTHSPRTRKALDRTALARFVRETRWLGLEIVATEAGGEDEARGVVEFVARGVNGGRRFGQRERSRFQRIGGAWHYVDGDVSEA